MAYVVLFGEGSEFTNMLFPVSFIMCLLQNLEPIIKLKFYGCCLSFVLLALMKLFIIELFHIWHVGACYSLLSFWYNTHPSFRFFLQVCRSFLSGFVSWEFVTSDVACNFSLILKFHACIFLLFLLT